MSLSRVQTQDATKFASFVQTGLTQSRIQPQPVCHHDCRRNHHNETSRRTARSNQEERSPPMRQNTCRNWLGRSISARSRTPGPKSKGERSRLGPTSFSETIKVFDIGRRRCWLRRGHDHVFVVASILKWKICPSEVHPHLKLLEGQDIAECIQPLFTIGR